VSEEPRGFVREPGAESAEFTWPEVAEAAKVAAPYVAMVVTPAVAAKANDYFQRKRDRDAAAAEASTEPT
jgi:hypothetical protein